MSNWSDTQITAKGRALDAKVTAGATTLVFTKMQLGSGIVAAENVDNMEGLDSPRMDLGISSCAVSKADNTICSVVAVASSNNVENSFLIKELGLFATDPDEGEILYAIMFDTEPDRMPNKNVASPVTLTFQVNVMSANAASIKAVIDPAGLISMATLNAVVDEHNNDKNAHGIMLDEHNADGKSHQDIRNKITADIAKHNKDEVAHPDIRQLIVDHNTNPKSHPHQLRPPLKRSTAYAKGDICFHDSLPSYAYLECITAGTTAENEPVFTDVNTNITDGTAVFRVITNVRKVNGNYADKNGNINVKEYEHPDSGVEAGTYTSVTVNAQGHVTAGSNPATNNTLVEYRYNEDGSWYRKYSDGWLEQGGMLPAEGAYVNRTITLVKAMANSSYIVLLENGYPSRMNEMHGVWNKTTTSFQATNIRVSGDGQGNWYACGMGAE